MKNRSSGDIMATNGGVGMAESEAYEKMRRGEPFIPDAYLYQKQSECSAKLVQINSLPYGNPQREALLQSLFSSLGEDNVIKDGFKCNYGFNISIGSHCYFNYNLVILDSFEVEIGNNVFIAPNVVISPVTHPKEAKNRRTLIGGKVTIEDDVWIGANAVILPGVTLHRGAVVGAGAVVTKDVPADTVVGGVPAKFIKTVDNQ